MPKINNIIIDYKDLDGSIKTRNHTKEGESEIQIKLDAKSFRRFTKLSRNSCLFNLYFIPARGNFVSIMPCRILEINHSDSTIIIVMTRDKVSEINKESLLLKKEYFTQLIKLNSNPITN